MQTVPQIQPITNMQKNYSHVVSLLDNGPVFLTRQSETAAVLVAPSEWNTAATRLAYLERIILGDQADARIEAGQYSTVEDVEAALAS